MYPRTHGKGSNEPTRYYLSRDFYQENTSRCPNGYTLIAFHGQGESRHEAALRAFVQMFQFVSRVGVEQIYVVVVHVYYLCKSFMDNSTIFLYRDTIYPPCIGGERRLRQTMDEPSLLSPVFQSNHGIDSSTCSETRSILPRIGRWREKVPTNDVRTFFIKSGFSVKPQSRLVYVLSGDLLTGVVGGRTHRTLVSTVHDLW